MEHPNKTLNAGNSASNALPVSQVASTINNNIILNVGGEGPKQSSFQKFLINYWKWVIPILFLTGVVLGELEARDHWINWGSILNKLSINFGIVSYNIGQ